MSTPKIRLQLAQKLKDERRKAKLTQEKVAEIIEVSVRYYQILESKNPSSIKIDLLDRIAKAFRIKPAQLLDF